MFLDYDGTLREIEVDPAAATPTPAVRELLDALSRHDRLDVTVISGRTPRDLEVFLGAYRFGLIAEHGASFRRPHAREWEQLDEGVNYGWRDEVRAVMGRYAAATPGSFVEEKRTSLVWHYRRCDPQPAEGAARQLAADLAGVAGAWALCVRGGKKIVEVTPDRVNKAAAVRQMIDRWRPADSVVVVAGDDTTDESMFQLDLPNLLTIRVGGGETHAAYRLAAPDDLRRLLLRTIATSD